MAALIDALDSTDHDTILFLLEALSNADAKEWEPILAPFVDDTSDALSVLHSDTSDVLSVLHSAKEIIKSRSVPPPPPEYDSTSIGLFSRTKRTTILGAENRAISLRQLRQVIAYIESHADTDGSLPWFDRNELSPTYDCRLHVNTINLYHVVDWVVKPITEASCCSLVEMLASRDQKPRWFVSHAWAEPVKDFVLVLTKHAEVRQLTEDDYFWVCGYANNQHKICEDIDPDPKKTSFYLAMQNCEGVLLCLDPMATPFTRIWCCFEEAMIVEGENLLLDIATVKDGEAFVLSDGFVKGDLRDGEKHALEFKRFREIGFPLELLEKGYSIDIRYAESCRQDDKRRILNTIAGDVPPDELDDREPDLTHPSFTRVNNILRGIFAEAASRKAAEAGRIDSVIQVLQQDTYRRKLTLNLGGSNRLDLMALANLAGHPSIEELIIDFSYSSLHDVSGVGVAVAGLPRLRKLSLSFRWCLKLKEATALSKKGFRSLECLTHLKLDYKNCSFSVFLPCIEELQALESLFIDYSYTRTSAGKKILEGIFQLKNLRTLSLKFKGCQQKFTHLDAFQGLERLTLLEELSLDFAYTLLRSARGLGVIRRMKRLSRCSLNFLKCTELHDMSWLPQAVTDLKEIDIGLSECKKLDPALQSHFTSLKAILKAFYGNSFSSQIPKHDILQLNIGQEIEYFCSFKKRWFPAIVQDLLEDEIRVKVREANGSFPRRISGSDISFRIRTLHHPGAGFRSLSEDSVHFKRSKGRSEKTRKRNQSHDLCEIKF